MITLLLILLTLPCPSVPTDRTTEQALVHLESLLPGLDLHDGVIILSRNDLTKLERRAK